MKFYKSAFTLNIEVSFVLVRVDQRLCKCAPTLPLFVKKTFLCSVFAFVCFVFFGGGGRGGGSASWRMGLKLERFTCFHQRKMSRHRKMSPSLVLYSNLSVASRLKTALTALVIVDCPSHRTDALLVAQPPF